MYVSVDFAVFGHYLSVWVRMKQQLKLDCNINKFGAWRLTVKQYLADLRNKIDWGWSWYTETAT